MLKIIIRKRERVNNDKERERGREGVKKINVLNYTPRKEFFCFFVYNALDEN